MRKQNLLAVMTGVAAAAVVFTSVGSMREPDRYETGFSPSVTAPTKDPDRDDATASTDTEAAVEPADGGQNVDVSPTIVSVEIAPEGDGPSDATPDETAPDPGDPAPPDATPDPSPAQPPVTADPPAGSSLPEVNPIGIDGAETTFYLPENSSQAALLGLDKSQVRSWGMRLGPSGDPATDHQRILDGLRSSGVSIEIDMLSGSDAGFGMIGGSWRGYVINIIVGNWTSLTVNLIDMP